MKELDYNVDLVDIECQILHETEQAWRITDGKKEAWIPKSVGELEVRPKSNYDIMTMPAHFAAEKGLI